MAFYRSLGKIPHKRHVQFRSQAGELYHEELMGLHGFAGPQSLLYHLTPPTQVHDVQPLGSTRLEFEEEQPLKHRLLNTLGMEPDGDAITGRLPLMGNQDVVLSIARPTVAMDYWYRFAHGDEVIFVHEGTGLLESQFGVVSYRPGDYLVIPTGVIWRMIPDADSTHRLLIIEAFGHIDPPQRYLNRLGQFMEHSPYCERDLRGPAELVTRDDVGDFEVRVKARGLLTSYRYRHHPLDVVGWDGCLYPYAFNIEDFEPITGRLHQPPPVHQTFDGPGFVVCSFVPRLFDYHPDSIPAPYNHSNVDSDEVLYYVDGNFMSRKGINTASLTVHPNGIPHGPHPGTYEGSIGQEKTNELAVMIDTFRPLKMTKQSAAFEDTDYFKSWQEPKS
jgi:homogentisate 1,2-dioxygenase